MFEHQKKMISEISFNKELFKKEIIKSFKWLEKEEILRLYYWLLSTFHNTHKNEIRESFSGLVL